MRSRVSSCRKSRSPEHSRPIAVRHEKGGTETKAAVFHGQRDLRVGDVPEPETRSGGAKIEVGWGASRVWVDCICPGGVDTSMIVPVLENEEILDFMRESTPLGRLAHPEETAWVTLFLASDETYYVNGAIVPVDGGWTAR